jgi:hypothetical protein
MRRLFGVVLVDVVIVPRDSITGGVETTPKPADTGLAVMVVAHIFLARPNQFDRIRRLRGDARCLYGEVVERPAPEAATQVLVVQNDLRLIHADSLGYLLGEAQRVLRAQP